MAELRHASIADLDALASIESASYPPAEGASRESLRSRLAHFSDCFWLLENEDGTLVSFINGMRTELPDLIDEMYDDASMHDPNGSRLMIFSVVTAPGERRKGYAAAVMRRVIEDMSAQGVREIVLTCKEGLLGFYGQFGYVNEGISGSTHGDVLWYQMRLRLE